MTRISRRHPRYESLVTRTRLAVATRTGVVVPEGLIAHGRGEAFDYFLGERSTPSARASARAAAQWLANARAPVLSVNGNVAALAADHVARLARRLPHLTVEINLFHRSPARVRAIGAVLKKAGVPEVRGVRATARIPHLSSDRALVDEAGIARADVVLVPLEDGDRALALRRAGKRTIAVDLNPLSRTARSADLPIIDELRRALANITAELPAARARRELGKFPRFDRARALADALSAMRRRLTRETGRPSPRGSVRASPRPSPGIRRRSRRRR